MNEKIILIYNYLLTIELGDIATYTNLSHLIKSPDIRKTDYYAMSKARNLIGKNTDTVFITQRNIGLKRFQRVTRAWLDDIQEEIYKLIENEGMII